MLPININQAYKQVVSQENLAKVADSVKGRYRDLTKAAKTNRVLGIAIVVVVGLATSVTTAFAINAFKMLTSKAISKSKSRESVIKAIYDQAVKFEESGNLVEAQKKYQEAACFRSDLSTEKLREMFIISNYKFAQLADRPDTFLQSPVHSRIFYAKVADLDASSIPSSCLEAYKDSLSKQIDYYKTTGNTRLLQECEGKLSKLS
ncbi:MAG: hypothetical protein GWP59_07975 [Chlamydiales bacterium]|nr:hypothetical protein [Chlamydiales bacterium]